MHLLAAQFFFHGDDWGFVKEGVKTYLMAPMSPLTSPGRNFFCLPIHQLWPIRMNENKIRTPSTNINILFLIDIAIIKIPFLFWFKYFGYKVIIRLINSQWCEGFKTCYSPIWRYTNRSPNKSQEFVFIYLYIFVTSIYPSLLLMSRGTKNVVGAKWNGSTGPAAEKGCSNKKRYLGRSQGRRPRPSKSRAASCLFAL